MFSLIPKVIFCFISLMLFIPVHSAYPPPSTELCSPPQHALSIAELLDIALRNNPETRAAWWNANRAAVSVDISKSAYYPSLAFRGSVANGLDYRYINGQETNYTTVSGDLILSYMLYDFGERHAACEAAKAALNAANWQSDWTLQKVMYHVIYNAYTFLNSQEQLISRLASLKDANTSLQAAIELQRAGLRSVTDVYALKASISDLQMSIALQKAETEIDLGKLAASLGLDVDSRFTVAPLPDPQLDAVMQANVQQLIASAKQKRSDLMAKRFDLQQRIAQQSRVSKACLPKLSVSGDTGYQRYFEDKANGYNYNIGLFLDIPIFNGFEQIYQKKAALSDVQLSEIEIERMELEIALEVLTYSYWFDAAQEVLRLAHENLQNSIQTFEGVLDKYKAGTQSIFDLTAAQRQLAEARLKKGDAKTRWYRSLAQLAYATGTIMPNSEVPCITVE